MIQLLTTTISIAKSWDVWGGKNGMYEPLWMRNASAIWTQWFPWDQHDRSAFVTAHMMPWQGSLYKMPWFSQVQLYVQSMLAANWYAEVFRSWSAWNLASVFAEIHTWVYVKTISGLVPQQYLKATIFPHLSSEFDQFEAKEHLPEPVVLLQPLIPSTFRGTLAGASQARRWIRR